MTAPAALDWRRAADVLSAAVGIVGVTFGVLADAAGVSLAKTVAMSAFVFTGASQFVAVSSIDGGSTAVAAFGSAMLLAARNALYGPVVAPYLPRPIGARLAASQFVIDETTAMATAQPDADRARRAFWRTAIGLWLFWNVGTAVGHLAGSVVGDPTDWGLDAAFAASFVVMLKPHLGDAAGRTAAAVGALVALVGVPLLPAGAPLLVSAVAVVPAYVVTRRSRT